MKGGEDNEIFLQKKNSKYAHGMLPYIVFTDAFTSGILGR